jgi:hypothetical protein
VPVAYQGYDAYNIVLMQDRRRVPRVAFGGVAEVSAVDLSKYVIAAVTVLSRFGCSVKTTANFSAGSKVNARITYNETEFAAPGVVAYALPEMGIGIVFGAVSSKDQAVLEHWLSEPETDFEGISAREAVRIRMAFLDDFPVELTCPECHKKVLATISLLKEEKAYTFPCGHTAGTERFRPDIATAERKLERMIRKIARE